MAAEQLPADALAAAVELITGLRAGLPAAGEEYGRRIGATMAELVDRYPGHDWQVLAWLIGHLAKQAAHACGEWEKTAEGTPAADWLATVGFHAATNRS